MTSPSFNIIVFLEKTRWLDGTPLIEQFPPFQLTLFREFEQLDENGRPCYNLAVWSRGKKQAKTLSGAIYALYRLLFGRSPRGNDCAIISNSLSQSDQTLDLVKKLIDANNILASEVRVMNNEIRGKHGSLSILPSRNSAALHGRSLSMIVWDEIHAYADYRLFEALAPDPNRADEFQQIITTYDGPGREGTPLFDFKQRGLAGSDPNMLFSWYSAGICTDEEHVAKTGDDLIWKANPCLEHIPGFRDYIETQRLRLPTAMFRRLHLNQGESLQGSFLDATEVQGCVATGRKSLPYNPEIIYRAFVDMSGGTDDAVLCIAHKENSVVVIDRILSQPQRKKPFDPLVAVSVFCNVLREYSLYTVTGDKYAGNTFAHAFQSHGITYRAIGQSKHDLYLQLEIMTNAGNLEIPDLPKLTDQLMSLCWQGQKVDHPSGGSDDWANACAGAAHLAGKLSPATGEIQMHYRESSHNSWWQGNPEPAHANLSDIGVEGGETSFWDSY